MALSAAERKARLPFGKQREIAKAEGVSEAFVSSVVNARYTPTTPRGWRKYRRVQVRVARTIGVPVAEAFATTSEPTTSEPTPTHAAA